MFRNPVLDLLLVVPALLIAGLLGMFVLAGTAHAEVLVGTLAATSTPGLPAVTASTSGTTFPDASQQTLLFTRANATTPLTEKPLSPLSVRTILDLETYARASLASNPPLESVQLSGKGIVVVYERNSRLFGVLPITVPITLQILPDASVSFSAPWYTPITLTLRDRMETALEVRAHALLTSEGYLASTSLSPMTQAELLDMVRDIITINSEV